MHQSGAASLDNLMLCKNLANDMQSIELAGTIVPCRAEASN